jgi:outer membrane protein assembly factor BamB
MNLNKNILRNKRIPLISVFMLISVLIVHSNLNVSLQGVDGSKESSLTKSALNGGAYTFRLLAVERQFDSYNMKSAEYFIDALLKHTNWNNASATYVSYIHLLSGYNLASHAKYGHFYKGSPTKANMKNEITNFLCQPAAGENTSRTFRILYYNGHGDNGYLSLDQNYNYSDLESDMTSGGLGNNNCTVIILDTCKSGSAIDDGKCGGTLNCTGWAVLSACKSTELANGWTWATSDSRVYPGYWAIFTGYNSTKYYNGTKLPVGLIGAMHGGADDSNNDGWFSAGELFAYAKTSTTEYTKQDKDLGYPDQNPVSFYGVVGGNVPIIPKWYLWVEPPIPASTPSNGKPQIVKLIGLPHDEWWWRHGHDTSGTGYSYCYGSSSNNLLYNRDLAGTIFASSSVVEGMVFVGIYSGTVGAIYALDMKNGEIVWRYPQTGYLPAPIRSSPAVENAVVFFGTEAPDRRLYAIDAYTGLPRWISSPLGGGGGGGVFSSPAVADNRVFVGTLDGYFFCLNATSGQTMWSYTIGAPISSSPAVAYGKVFFGIEAPAPGPGVCALNELTGAPLIWFFPSGTSIRSSPAVADGLVFIGSEGGTLYALIEANGSPLWQRTLSGPISSSPAVDSLGHLVVVGAGNNVECREEMTGNPRWMFSTSGAIGFSSPGIAANGLVYTGSSDGFVYCINEITGTEVWRYSTGGPVASSPAISAEHVFIGSNDGRLYCLGLPWPDISIVNCWPSKQNVMFYEEVTIYCTVENIGPTTETFNLACYLDPIHSNSKIFERPPKKVLDRTITLNPGESITVSDTLYVVSLVSTSYLWKLWADADTVMYEVKMRDNRFTFGTISVLPPAAPTGWSSLKPRPCLD